MHTLIIFCRAEIYKTSALFLPKTTWIKYADSLNKLHRLLQWFVRVEVLIFKQIALSRYEFLAEQTQ